MKIRFTGPVALGIFCVFSLAAPATAATYTFDLTQSYADQNGSGVTLTPFGGTRDGTGYHFQAKLYDGVNDNEGLSLPNVIGAGNAYSINMTFSIDATSSWRKLIDFKDRQSDTGLYNLNSAVQLYPAATSAAGVFTANQTYNMLVERTLAGLFTVTVDGNLVYSLDDSGPNNGSFTGTFIAFFLDNIAGPAPNEVAGGTVSFIEINANGDTVVTPIPAALPLFASGLGALGFAAYRRKRRQAA